MTEAPTISRDVAATKAILDSAAALGASLLCGPLGVLSGAAPTVGGEGMFGRVPPRGRGTRGRAWRDDRARVPEPLRDVSADLAALVREVDHPRVRMMYDTFHAHIEEKDPREALRACSDVLVHVHASENDRSTPGTGQVGWDATFDGLREIGYDGHAFVRSRL